MSTSVIIWNWAAPLLMKLQIISVTIVGFLLKLNFSRILALLPHFLLLIQSSLQHSEFFGLWFCPRATASVADNIQRCRAWKQRCQWPCSSDSSSSSEWICTEPAPPLLQDIHAGTATVSILDMITWSIDEILILFQAIKRKWHSWAFEAWSLCAHCERSSEIAILTKDGILNQRNKSLIWGWPNLKLVTRWQNVRRTF